MSDLPPPNSPAPSPPPPDNPSPNAQPGPKARRSRRTPLIVALSTIAVAAAIAGGVVVVGSGGDDDSAPANTSTEETQETRRQTSVAPSTDPTNVPTDSPDTGPATTGPPEVEDDPSAAAAANVGALVEQESAECPVDAAVVGSMVDDLGSQLAQRGVDRGGLHGSTFFRQRTTGAAAIVCSAGTREGGVAFYVGPVGDASLRDWAAQALINDSVRLREVDSTGDAAVFGVDTSTEVGKFSLAQKGAAWTDGPLAMMLLGVSFGGRRVDVDLDDASRALVGAAEEIVTELAAIEPAEPPPAVPIDEPFDTSAAVANLLSITARGRSDEAMECPVSIRVLDEFNDPVESTFLNRILDDTSIMGAGNYFAPRRGPTALRCTAGIENGLVSVYLGTLRGADPGRWLSMIEPTLQYKQVGTDHQGTLLAVRLRLPDTSILGAAWTDGDLIVMIAGVGSPNVLDFGPNQAAAGLRTASKRSLPS
jgi:hypothetical protein